MNLLANSNPNYMDTSYNMNAGQVDLQPSIALDSPEQPWTATKSLSGSLQHTYGLSLPSWKFTVSQSKVLSTGLVEGVSNFPSKNWPNKAKTGERTAVAEVMDTQALFTLIQSASCQADQASMTQLHLLAQGNQRVDSRGFTTALVTILQGDPNTVPAEVRLMCSLILKNIIERQWIHRGHSDNTTVGDDEKSNFRSFCTSNLGEPDSKVATQLAAAVAKVARHDWPKGEWPELLTILFDRIKECTSTESAITRCRALGMLHEVLKELSLKKSGILRKEIETAVRTIFPAALYTWRETHLTFQQLVLSTQTELLQPSPDTISVLVMASTQVES